MLNWGFFFSFLKGFCVKVAASGILFEQKSVCDRLKIRRTQDRSTLFRHVHTMLM